MINGKNISIVTVLGILVAMQSLGYGLVTEISLRPMRCNDAQMLEILSQNNLSRADKEVGNEISVIEEDSIAKTRRNLARAVEQQSEYC